MFLFDYFAAATMQFRAVSLLVARAFGGLADIVEGLKK
jgi:hypothetical protein